MSSLPNASAPAATVFSRVRMLGLGVTPREVDKQLDRGQWTRVKRGWYEVAGEAPTPLDRHRSLIEAMAPSLPLEAAFSHVSAAVLLGVDPWDLDLSRVHVTRPIGAGGRVTKNLVVHPLRPGESLPVERVSSRTVTSAARTAADIACSAPLGPALVVADALLRLNRADRGALQKHLNHLVGRHGAAKARRIIEIADGRSESAGESRSRLLMLEHGWPLPDLQRAIPDHRGNTLGRVDFYWADHRVIGEFDGAIKYGRYVPLGSTAGDVVMNEKRREEKMVDTGREVLRWTWPELEHWGAVTERFWRKVALAARRHP